MINRPKKYLVAIFIVLTAFTACKKSEKRVETTEPKTEIVGELAKVTTTSFSEITTTAAVTGGTIITKGGSTVTEQGICWATTPNPTIEKNKAGVQSISGSGTFTSQLNGLTASTKYFVRAFAINKAGVAYGNELELTTANILNATFNFPPMYIVGSTVAAADIEVLTDGGDAITERGIVWSTSPNPSTTDNKIKHGNAGLGKFRVVLKQLTPQTMFYARAYSINSKGTSYSSAVNFKTIPKGNVTYTFNKSANPNADELAAYGRLQVAIDSAIWYLNNYTSAKKHLYLNYVDGVPTADANNEGWMRFGSNSSFHNVRTMLHEADHSLGTGTSSWWQSKIVNGKLQAPSVTALLRLITKDTNAELSGDTQHWWPYGLNQNSEVTSSWDLVYNCLILEAMRKDGLTQYSGSYSQ